MNSIRRILTTGNRLNTLSQSPTLQQHRYASKYTPRLKKASPSLNNNEDKAAAAVLKKEAVTWPKPSVIPWQAKVVNSVSLIGRVKIPVQFEASSSDGKSWAGTIISQDDGVEASSSLSSSSNNNNFTSFWIPVIFEGDMAHVAMCHLKEKDYVHVTGHLSVDVPPFKLSEVQANVQVMAHSINFVETQSKKPSRPGELDRWTTKNSVSENNIFPQELLKEPAYISMEQDTLSKKSISDVAFEEDNFAKLPNNAESSPVHKQSLHASWRDLLTNPKEWLDNRENKRNGLVKANYPDFKHKDTGDGLWLDRAPVEVLQGLSQLEFFRPNNGEKVLRRPNTGEKVNDADSWKHLIENPGNWWDNRVDKRNQKGPDFKNKDSGKGLWLGSAPSWALSSLPPLKATTADVNTQKKWASY